MEVNQLKNLLAENIDILASVDGYKSILSRANGLHRFDVINRILISIQYNNAIDIKTNEEWLMLGRNVSNNKKPIFIIMPRLSYEYIDTDSGNTVNTSEFTLDELNKALEYNVIERRESIETLYTMPVYDVKQTTTTSMDSYKFNKPIISSKSVIEMTCRVMECNLELSDTTYYSKSTNTLYVSKQPYTNLVLTIANILAKYMINNKLNYAISSTTKLSIDELNEYEIELIENSLAYTIGTIYNVSNDLDFEYIKNTYVDRIMDILNIVDYLMLDIMHNVEYSYDNYDGDAVSNISKLRKAEAILDVMEANSINKKIKGL